MAFARRRKKNAEPLARRLRPAHPYAADDLRWRQVDKRLPDGHDAWDKVVQDLPRRPDRGLPADGDRDHRAMRGPRAA